MSNELKHDKISIEKRHKCLRNFLLDSNSQQVSIKQIHSFYKSKYGSLSPATISRDLKAINAKCDKKNGNKYYLDDVKKVHFIKSKISNLLDKCIIYKPLRLSKSLNVLDNDSNPSLNYYCITIKSKSSNYEEYYIESLLPNLKKLPDFYDNYDKFNYIDIKESNSSIMFIFDDKYSMKNFYVFLNGLRDFND